MSKAGFFCSASAIAALMALGAAGQAAAQTDKAANEVSEVVVTGSFIRGTPEDAALPVDVISQDDIEKQGSPSTVELIKNLSVSSGVLGDTNQFDTRSQGSEGSGSVNLRGLGAQRTLVLMNGRRMATNPFGQGAAGIVDTNTIPSAAIGRVEILKEGAAATYGSDAIGGVVNFITRTNLNGFEVGGSLKRIAGSKGNYDASIAWGHTFENGNVLLTAGWQHNSELRTTDRDWAIRRFTDNPEGGFSGGNSTTLLVPIARNPTTGVFGIAGAPAADLGCVPLGGVQSAPTNCRFQFTPFDNLVEREDKYQIYGEANFNLDENNKFHAELLYAKTDVPVWKTSPSYLTLQTPTAATSPLVGNLSLPASIPSAGWYVPASNPGVIAYRAANPGAGGPAGSDIFLSGVLYRPIGFGGNPLFSNRGSSEGLRQYEAYRVSAGFKGNLPFGGIGYDTALTYGQEVGRRSGYDTVVPRLQQALKGFGSLANDTGGGCTAAETNNFTTNAGNQALGCYYFNPLSNAVSGSALTGAPNPGFNPAVANNTDLIRWFFPQVSTKQKSSIVVWDGVLNGELPIELAGGKVGWAAGGQYRRDMFDSKYSDFSNIGVNPCIDTPFNGSTNCSVRNGPLVFLGTGQEQELSRNVWAGFGELAVPVTDDIQLQLAGRYEKYERVGSTTNFKVGARWQITDWFAVRGGVGTTFRGPPLTSLANASGTALQFIAGSFRAIDIFGNPNLKPETADNYNLGAVFNVGGRFKATVDYWRFDFKDPIIGEPSGSIVSAMFPGNSPVNCGNPAFAALQARFTFQGACSVVNVSRVRTQTINGSNVKTSGIDVLANYDFGDFMGGNVHVGGSATYTIDYKIADVTVEGVIVEPAYDAVGFLNYLRTATSLPQWKGQAFVEYSRGAHNLRFTLNYIDSYKDQRTSILTPNAVSGQVITKGQKIRATYLAEIDYRVQLPWDTTATFSIDNLFDRDPSFARLDLNYDPFSGNVYGRTYKMSVKKRF